MERRTPRKTGQSTALPATARPETAQSETAQSESNPSQSSRPLKSGRKKTKKLSARSKSARSIAAASASHIAAAADTDDSAASSSAIASLAGGTSHCHSLSNSDLIDKGLPLLAVHSLRGDAEALLKEGLACDGAQLRLVRDLYDCSAEHNVFAWVRVHEAAREGFGLQLTDDYDNSGGISLQGDGRGRLPPRLFSTVIDVQGGLALNLDQVQLIQLLFDGSRRVTLTRLPTVPSTRLQRLQVVSIDGAGNQQSAIILLDIAASLTSELENVRRVTELAGAEYVKIPHPPQYLDQQRRLLTESSSRTDDVGAVIMQLPGACWTTPELSGQVALSTVQRMLQRVLQESGDRNESELSVITELWTKDGQLHALATRTATRADRAAAESGGFLEQQLRRIAHQLTVTFVPVDLSEAGDYQPPKKLRECLARLEAAQRLQMNQVSGRSAFAESFVRQCLSDVWSDCSMVIMLLDRLQALLAAPSNWLSSWRPLLTYQHGNLCTANALIDSLGSVWLVDWSRSAMGNPFNDVAKIVVTTLLEHHSITLDEIRSAGAERLQRILGIERSAAERLFERATSCQTKDQLAHALDGDKALAPALARLNDEFGARQTLSQVTRLFESLLEPVDGKPPQLVHIASRKLPAWATSRAQQYLHRIIVSVIRAAMGLVSTCSRRGTEGSDESSAKALAASDLHVAHLLFPVLEMCLTASCEVLSVWQKRLAWEMAQQCSRTLSIALQHEPVALPSDATFEPASYSTLRLALGPVLLRKAIASCLTGGQGTMHGAILVQDGDQVIVPLATVGKLHILLGNASGLASADRNGKSDPYVVFSCATNKAMSTVKPKTLDPTWNETIVMDGILHDLIDSGLTLKVFDSDGAPKPEKDDCIGQKHVTLDCLRCESQNQFIESLKPGSADGVAKGKVVFDVKWEPSAEQIRVSLDLDAATHVVLPWPVPNAEQSHRLLDWHPTELSGEGLRRAITPSFSRYACGQKVVLLQDDAWLNATVLQPPDDLCSTVHKVEVEGTQTATNLHPWNHAPRIQSTLAYTGFRMRYTRALLGHCTHVTDTITGNPIDLFSQCVPLEMSEPPATIGKLHILLGNASGLASADLDGKSDPYVVFSGAENKAISTVKPKTLNPVWNETYVLVGALHDFIGSGLTVKIFDSDGAPKPEKDDCIGQKPVALDCLRRENPSQFIESLNAGSANGVGKGKIVFAVTWEPPPSSPPISSGGIPNPAAVPQLHEWLRGAHASRTKIPSTMLRLHRLVSQGMPDEISVRLQREFGDLARGFSAQKRDATCLHAAADELALAKSTFASLWERLLSKTRAELDEYISIEKQKEETVKQRQQKELQVLLDSNQGEMDAIVSEQQHALAKLDREQYVVRQDLSVKEILTKKKQSEETDAELKIFKDGQYRDKAAQQLSQQQRRADGEQQLSADKDADMNACQERRLSETRTLQEEQQKEIGQFQAASKHEAMLRAAQYQSIEDNLSKEQASNHKEFDAVQAKERADFDAEMTLRMTNFQKAWEAKEAEQKQKLEDERHRRFNENRDHKKRLTDNQTEERTQLLARQKVAMKDLVERHQEAKAALAVKQEEDRKADFARRRQRMEEEAKAKEAKAKEAKANKGKNMNTAKEADTKVVVPAPAVEEVPEEKKIPPAKEKTMLETALKEEREAFTNAHDLEVTTLTSEQKVRMQAFEAEQEAQLAALMEVQAAARKALLAKKEVEAQQLKNSGEEERARLEKKLEAQAADLQKSHEAARRKIAEQRAKDEEEALMKQQDAAKRLDKRLQVAKDALKQEHHELQNSITEKHEELRRQFIQAQDDEMAIFTQKQDDARKEVVGVHKAAEKQLDEKLKAERKVVDDQLDEERATFMAKHANVRNILTQEHNQKRGVLESKHFIERKDLVSEQQRARTVFIAQQQIAKDQHVVDFRTRLYQIVENAQNEFNLAAIRNACILVTGGPASGKTTTIRQLLAHVLRVIQREQEFQLVPILICVPDLKDNLLRDREKIARVQSKHKFERIELDARHEAERVALASRTTPEAATAKELVDDRQAEESKHLETEQDNELQEAAWRQSKFARSWNWVDAHLQCVYGPKSGTYTMLRQALLSRRALLLIDGLDEGGPVSEEIQRHITEVLAPQGHTMVVTSRTEGLRLDWFSAHFEHMSLRPLSDALQAQLVELRLGANPSCVQKLLKYIRTQVPLDNKGQRETCSPLNISLMIAIFDNLGDVPVPDSITSLYEIASKILLERSLGGALHGVASAEALALITPLLEAIFFRAHAMHMREIEMYHVEAAALALGAPDQLAAVEWPPYKGRVRVGQVVKLLRGESAGRVGLLTSDSRGKLINGHTPRSPFRITFFDQTLSPWVKTGDFISSGLEHAPYNTKMGVDGQRKAIRLAFDKLPEAFHQAVHAVCTWVLTDQMPMLSLLQSEPLKMQASFPFLQEFFSARALCKGRALPGEPPWRWSAWWSNTLRLGSEMGKSFGSGLVRSTCSGLKLDLAGQVAGHRPTSIAAISQLMLGVMSMDLSQNCITIEELKILAKALQNSATLLELSLSKNSLGDEGAAILSAHIAESKLMSLNLFGSGIKEEGAKALASVISSSTSLTHLNLQYNAVRGETKKMLEAANAARVPQLVLVL